MSVTYNYSGKKTLVTGGSRGIGLGIAQAFVSAGADVHITGTQPNVSAYEDDLSAFTYHQCRMNEVDERAALITKIGALDVLVNNAGGPSLDEYKTSDFANTMEVNITATADLCYGFHAALKQAEGAVINLSSIGGYIGMRDFPAYSASKHAIGGFTMSLADKWARDNIRVNAIAPGFIETRSIDWARSNPDVEKGVLSSIPLRRFGTPEDIANVALFLASPQAAYVVGHNMVVDGGYLLR